MPDQAHDRRHHLVVKNTSTAINFKAHTPAGGKEKNVPDLPRQAHGKALLDQLKTLQPQAAAALEMQKQQGLESGLGLQIQFISQPEVELAFESLANSTQKIELLSVRFEDPYTIANVFVPEGKLAHFEKYVTEYLQEKRDKVGRPLDHKNLLNTIESIRAAEIRALWTDDVSMLPDDPSTPFWWEVWLPVRESRQASINDFRKLADLSGCRVAESQFNFPERTVVLMFGSEQQFTKSVMALNCVAELRKAKETAEFFDGMGVEDQREWTDDLLQRSTYPGDGEDVPYICLLDSGVNRGHPLLAPFISAADTHTVNPAWGTDDTANHGTGMAGLALFGDLTAPLASQFPMGVSHRLESVKLLTRGGSNHGDARHHADLFKEAVARPEISAPARSRVFSTAVTASDYRDRGRPSSWSSAVDSLAADPDGAGQFPRLFIVSAGNTTEPSAWMEYPDSLTTNLIHDPGQSWNAITVGACTHKTDTQGHASLEAISAEGGLSPFTTTSKTWDSSWPLKPEVVLEGGNASRDAYGANWMSSLSLLTTNNEPQDRLLTTSNATSAASALCARLAAQIMAAYPHLRPETVRALIVHSAEWTEAMRSMFLPKNKTPTKNDYVSLIRHCGWGTPSLARALWSAGNSLTLIVEDEVHPFAKVKDKGVVTRHMNLHALPWPKDELEALQNSRVKMRVTLSYFVEPNPSSRGATSKYHYPSHRLRFDVKRPLDSSTEDFLARVNAAALREDEGDAINPKDTDWLLGERQRHRGSLHQDIWEGTAAELASRGFIAVYPANGWWRTRQALERFNLPARYSLIVSIQSEQNEIDLYNAISQVLVAV